MGLDQINKFKDILGDTNRLAWPDQSRYDTADHNVTGEDRNVYSRGNRGRDPVRFLTAMAHGVSLLSRLMSVVDTKKHNGKSDDLAIKITATDQAGASVALPFKLVVAKEQEQMIIGTEGDNTLELPLGNHTVVGGAGNDYLIDNQDENAYIFSKGDGSDVLVSKPYANSGHTNNILKFTDVAATEVTFSSMGKALQIAYPGGMIRIDNFFDKSRPDYMAVDSFEFTDRALNRVEVRHLTQYGQLRTTEGNSRHDYLHGTAGADILYGNEGDDYLEGHADEDYLVGGAGNDFLSGGANDDILQGDAGDDVLWGGLNRDRLLGGYGSDTYLFSKGDGYDRVIDKNEGQEAHFGVDKFRFSNVRSEEVHFSRQADNLLLQYGLADMVLVERFFDPSGEYRIHQFEFTDQMLTDDAVVYLAESGSNMSRSFLEAPVMMTNTVHLQELQLLIDAMAGSGSTESSGPHLATDEGITSRYLVGPSNYSS